MSCVANRFKAVKSFPRLFLAGALALLAQQPATAFQNVVLTWNPSSTAGVAGYKIYSGAASGNYTSVINAGAATNVTISGLMDGSTNYYSATTYDASGDESAFAGEVVFVAPQATNQTTTVPVNQPPSTPTTPTQPTGLHVVSNFSVASAPTDIHSVILSWDPSADTGVAGYQIFLGKAAGNYSSSWNIGPASSLVITGLVSGTTYYFSAREYDSAWNVAPMPADIHLLIPYPSVPVPTNPVVVTPVPTNSPVTTPVVTPTNSIVTVPTPTNSTPTNASVANVTPALNVVGNFAASVCPTNPHNAILTWNPSTDTGVTGYKVMSGAVTGHYSITQKVNMVSSLLVTGLVYGSTNFFAIQEHDAATNQGGASQICWIVPLKTNVPPTMNVLSNLNFDINAAQQTVTLSGISPGAAYEGQLVTVTASSSNPTLVPTPKVTYANPKTTGTLTFKPANGKTGTAIITVKVDDGFLAFTNHVITRTFTVTVVNLKQLAAMPKFSTQLKGGRVLKNNPVVLSVAMSGQAPFKYQWKFNGTNIAGQTAATLSMPAVKLSNAGSYMVQVSNSAGVTNSVVAALAVFTNTVPTIAAAAIPTAGQFSFQVPGEAGLKYVVEATTDLHNWKPVQTNTAPFTFIDTNAASYAQRYYRATYLP